MSSLSSRDRVQILEHIIIPAPDLEEQPQTAAIASINEEGAQMESLDAVEESIPEVILISSDSEDDSNADVGTVCLNYTFSESEMAKMIQMAAPLKELPKIGDSFIFKLPMKKGATAPCPTTEFLVGTCSYVNRRTKAMTLSAVGE